MSTHENSVATSDPELAKDEAATVKDPPVDSLYAYYANERADPGQLLRALKKAKLRSFAVEDRDRALAEIPALDPDFRKTLALAQKAWRVEGPLGPACLSFAGAALQREMNSRSGWTLDPDASALATLESIAGVLAASIRNKKEERRGVNLLMVAVLWLCHGRALDMFEAVPVIDRCVRSAKSRDDRTPRSVQRKMAEFLSRPPVSPAALRRLFAFVQPWVDRQHSIEAEAREKQATIDRLQDRSVVLSDELARRDQEIERLRRGISDRDRKIADLEDRLRSREVTARHDLTQLRARERGFLTGRLNWLLRNALEAATSQRPHPEVVRERLEAAMREIEEEAEWLGSSD